MQIYDVAPHERGWALVLHGGAGGRVEELALDVRGSYTGKPKYDVNPAWQISSTRKPSRGSTRRIASRCWM